MILPFFRAIFKHLWESLGCAVFTISGIVLSTYNFGTVWAVRSSWGLAGGCFFVASYKAWAEQAEIVLKLTTHADVRGSVHQVYRIVFATLDTLMVYASIFNDSSEVEPTIRHFKCDIETELGNLVSTSSSPVPIEGLIFVCDRDQSFDPGPFQSLSKLNGTPLLKHNHREGWLKFTFPKLPADVYEGARLRLIAVDGSERQHQLALCESPWPAEEGKLFIEPETREPYSPRRRSQP
jgi:hypothetical protein